MAFKHASYNYIDAPHVPSLLPPRSELVVSPPSSLPHTTSAFVQIQQQQQQGLLEAGSNLPGRPDSNIQLPLQIQHAMTQSQPGISTGPAPPIPTLTTPTTAVPTHPTTTYAFSSSLYQEERHEQGGGGGVMEPSHAPPPNHHHHSYYHDSYYHGRDRESYYGDPRDTQYRAPSAFFSEREVDHHCGHGYHPRPDDSRTRYDYSHYPDHPHHAGYGRYGPNYGYDDHCPMGGGYPPLYGPPMPRHGPAPLCDEYGMPPPRTPYYDPYDPFGYHHAHHHHQRPYDPRYWGALSPSPSSRGPPYGVVSIPYIDPYHQPSAAYEHDPCVQHQSESGYDSHTYPPQQLQPLIVLQSSRRAQSCRSFGHWWTDEQLRGESVCGVAQHTTAQPTSPPGDTAQLNSIS